MVPIVTISAMFVMVFKCSGLITPKLCYVGLQLVHFPLLKGDWIIWHQTKLMACSMCELVS